MMPQLRKRKLTKLERMDMPKHLSPRMREALSLVARGYQTDEIMREMGISKSTVKNMLTKTYDRLNARTRTEAVVKALQRGYIEVEGLSAHPQKASD